MEDEVSAAAVVRSRRYCSHHPIKPTIRASPSGATFSPTAGHRGELPSRSAMKRGMRASGIERRRRRSGKGWMTGGGGATPTEHRRRCPTRIAMVRWRVGQKCSPKQLENAGRDGTACERLLCWRKYGRRPLRRHTKTTKTKKSPLQDFRERAFVRGARARTRASRVSSRKSLSLSLSLVRYMFERNAVFICHPPSVSFIHLRPGDRRLGLLSPRTHIDTRWPKIEVHGADTSLTAYHAHDRRSSRRSIKNTAFSSSPSSKRHIYI